MHRSVLVALLAIVTILGLVHQGERPAKAAASLYLAQRCESNGTVSLAFVWEASDPNARQVWVDVSNQSNSWLPGTFTGAGPLPASATSFAWVGWQPGTSY